VCLKFENVQIDMFCKKISGSKDICAGKKVWFFAEEVHVNAMQIKATENKFYIEPVNLRLINYSKGFSMS